MDGRQLLIHLLREMRQNGKSGQVYYVVKNGGDGKIIVDRGEIHSLTFRGQPIEALTLGAYPIRKAIVVPSSARSTSANPNTPSMMAVLAALDMGGARAQNQDRLSVDASEVFSQ